MSYLIEDGLKVRFILDHNFFILYLGTPSEKIEETLPHKIMVLANQLNEMDIPNVLFAGTKVINLAEDLLEGKIGHYAVRRMLLRFIVNDVPDGDTPDIINSVWKSSSKVGHKNYLITPNEDLKKQFLGLGCSFEIESPDTAYHKIMNIAKKQSRPIVL